MHGGPRGVYGEGIFQEFQLLCAEGYAVIYTNPRGSAGYEEAYTQGVMRHYGEVDYEDFMDFTDEALKQYPWIDEKRLGIDRWKLWWLYDQLDNQHRQTDSRQR